MFINRSMEKDFKIGDTISVHETCNLTKPSFVGWVEVEENESEERYLLLKNDFYMSKVDIMYHFDGLFLNSEINTNLLKIWNPRMLLTERCKKFKV